MKSRFIGSFIALSLGMLVSQRAHAAGAPPVLLNASFDGDATGMASPTGWTSSGSTDADFTEWGGHASDFRLSHWSGTNYSVDTRQTVTGMKPGWYTLRGWVKRS